MVGKRRLRLILSALCAFPVVVAAALAIAAPNPTNDLFALGQAGGDTPARAPTQHAKENLRTTPLAKCGPGSHREPGVDGRVPEGSAKNGLNCNVALIGHQGTEGGFKVFRYVDAHRHVCAFYDQTLMFPLNALNPGAGSEGVAVLDMSNPSHPVKTATLATPPMLSPHESLNLNARRGLLAAVNGNAATEPGFVAIYSVHSDCRHPVLDSLGPFARLGHESGFSADGRTFYATSTAYQAITAIDVTDPKHPSAVWQGNIFSHGMSLSTNGRRAYIADPGNPVANKRGGLLILDTSQIQARKPNPKAREVSRLTWRSVSIPQNAIPFTRHGRPYLLEIDEYNQATLNPSGDPNVVGAARIIDISNERRPRIVSDLRLAIDQHAAHAAATKAGDPGTGNPAQGYAAHYCNIPTSRNPKVVACSFIASGLRVFDISRLRHPKEVAYYVAPPKKRSENGATDSDFAMSKPAFGPHRQIWWTDGTSGFYVLRVAKRAWPR
ncbi:MAG TPA: hypothetical protein VJU80_12300 [Solirubrobacteraceae bacterium]|nr:hypothetical protein [Solirubrobacteraceae bacterium]